MTVGQVLSSGYVVILLTMIAPGLLGLWACRGKRKRDCAAHNGDRRL